MIIKIVSLTILGLLFFITAFWDKFFKKSVVVQPEQSQSSVIPVPTPTPTPYIQTNDDLCSLFNELLDRVPGISLEAAKEIRNSISEQVMPIKNTEA